MLLEGSVLGKVEPGAGWVRCSSSSIWDCGYYPGNFTCGSARKVRGLVDNCGGNHEDSILSPVLLRSLHRRRVRHWIRKHSFAEMVEWLCHLYFTVYTIHKLSKESSRCVRWGLKKLKMFYLQYIYFCIAPFLNQSSDCDETLMSCCAHARESLLKGSDEWINHTRIVKRDF